VGRIEALRSHVETRKIRQRVGIPWLGHTCGHCGYCLVGSEILAVADAHFTFPLPEEGSDESLAPLLCAGLIGWRALRMAGEGCRVGLYGFGAAAHIVAQVLRWQGRNVFAFTRPGDTWTQAFAHELGALKARPSCCPEFLHRSCGKATFCGQMLVLAVAHSAIGAAHIAVLVRLPAKVCGTSRKKRVSRSSESIRWANAHCSVTTPAAVSAARKAPLDAIHMERIVYLDRKYLQMSYPGSSRAPILAAERELKGELAQPTWRHKRALAAFQVPPQRACFLHLTCS
jgi:hypothetical protein